MSTLVSTEACTLTDGVGDDGVARLVMIGRPDLAVADQVSARISPRSGAGTQVVGRRGSRGTAGSGLARHRAAGSWGYPRLLRRWSRVDRDRIGGHHGLLELAEGGA